MGFITLSCPNGKVLRPEMKLLFILNVPIKGYDLRAKKF
ncbi:hypothetical protein CIP106467_2518 [Citrobacter europaeus]|nr:hypothetical protein CIP106467_2518 [Citrobacter europaeus]